MFKFFVYIQLDPSSSMLQFVFPDLFEGLGFANQAYGAIESQKVLRSLGERVVV